MKRTDSRVAFPAALAIVMVVFLSAIFFTNANPSFAADGKKKGDRTTAVAHTETQIKQLQGALVITRDQDVLWNSLTKVMRENASDMDALTKDKADYKTVNSVENMKFHRQITEAHLNQLNKFIPAYEAFYASLSDEQKQTADTIFRTGKHSKHSKHKTKK